jgi:hypothetical protein
MRWSAGRWRLAWCELPGSAEGVEGVDDFGKALAPQLAWLVAEVVGGLADLLDQGGIGRADRAQQGQALQGDFVEAWDLDRGGLGGDGDLRRLAGAVAAGDQDLGGGAQPRTTTVATR